VIGPLPHAPRASHVWLRRAGAAAVALALITATACSSDDAAPPTTEAPTTTAEVTTTAAPTSTTEGEEVPTTTAGAPCTEPVAVPDGASALTARTGDVDGDGRDDALRSFLVDDAWFLQVEVASGYGTELELPTSGGPAVGLVGAADVDGDGAEEIWVRVGSGASTVILGIVRLEACTLERVTLESGQPVELPVGGSVGATAGVECRSEDVDADLTTFAGFHRADTRYDVTATQWALDGGVLSERSSSTTELRAEDPDFTRATTFTCHDLTL
jgi:hypothetical protein